MNKMERLEQQLDSRRIRCDSCVIELITRYGWRWKRCVNCGRVERI